MKQLIAFTTLLSVVCLAHATDAPKKQLFAEPQEIDTNVYSAIGATAPPTYENSGHNNNLSFIVTDEGVVVINAGSSYSLAKDLHQRIKQITDKPVQYVVLENGQGHAMLGTDYWQKQGATVIAHVDADKEIKEHGYLALARLQPILQDKLKGTTLSEPDETFSDKKVIELGDERIELLYLGPAHSPGDIVVWLPKRKLVISGDMAFHQRLLPVFDHTSTKGWINTWDDFTALGAERVVPGHGAPTNMQEVTRYTKDYLVYMRNHVQKVLDDGGDLLNAYDIDQSAYQHLDTFDELAKQNAGRIYREMEFDF